MLFGFLSTITINPYIFSTTNILIQAPQLRLPGKKRLIQEEYPLEAVVIDVSETPIEKPKKNKKAIIAARKKDIR